MTEENGAAEGAAQRASRSPRRLTRLTVIQPAVTTYRAEFWARSAQRLADRRVDLVVAHGGYESLSRADALKAEPRWTQSVPSVRLHVLGKSAVWRRWSRNSPDPDLVIVEQALKSLETYPLLVRMVLGGPSVAMWGQGRAYSTRESACAASLKQRLTRNTDWFFAYTQAGADHVVAHGFPATRVSVLNNTIDTDTLRRDLDAVSEDKVAAFRRHQGLIRGRTALFLGGVDRAKGIDFLLAAADEAARLQPGFVLLVGGAGAQLPDVCAAQRAGAPVRALGRLDGHEKALALMATDVLAIPEWIGLVAVDSLVAGRPIVSTWHPSHSPEHEYLTPDVTAEFATHGVRQYALALTELLVATKRLESMQRACVAEAPRYSLDLMVDSFVEGVLAWADVHHAGL